MDELADLAGSALHGVESLGSAALHGAEAVGEGVVHAVENEGADIVGAAYHGGAAIGDAISGDWDGAANEAISMSGDALGAATGGVTDLIGDGYDAIAGATGLPSAHELVHDGTQAVGNALGDAAYNLVHGGDSSDDGSADPGAGDDGSGGGDIDPSMYIDQM
ncbi:MAG TPA: hypothetical protein VFU73_15490 [Actinocrinis sp.]|nr:hypothetical protein [Actinocrinis sp.]